MSAVRASRTLLASLLACCVLFSAACAGGNALRGDALPADCFLNRSVRDYDALDDANIIIFGPGDNAYHVVLTTPALDLEGEFVIGIYDDGDGRVCPYGRDAIIVDGVLREEIRIRSIERIGEDDVEALRSRFGVIDSAGEGATVEQIQ
jgi:hypothetical protein